MGLEADFQAQPPTITVLPKTSSRPAGDAPYAHLFRCQRRRCREPDRDRDGLSAKVRADGPTYKILAQVNQSDLAFLRERARTIDAELWLDGRTLNAPLVRIAMVDAANALWQ
jgi:hypothetical protein